MTREKFTSPRITVTIAPEDYQTARGSDSGGCLIADAIRRVYPRPLRKDDVDVNVATIDIRDREEGVRYSYLTPANAQQCLLNFDQGWDIPPPEKIVLKGAVKITRIRKAGTLQLMTRVEQRAAKLLDLEHREAMGEPMTGAEKASLTRMRNPKPSPDRPTSTGPAEVAVVNGRSVVEGGSPMARNRSNMNLLGGRRRIFGAKVANPGQSFQAAVDAAVEARLAEKL